MSSSAAAGRQETLGERLYQSICARHDVKPNGVVAEQLSGPDLELTTIDCSRTFLGANGVRAVVDLLRYVQCVKAVSFMNNGIDTDAVHKLASLVEAHQGLTEVSLAGNQLSTPSARLLWDVSRKCRHVRSINLTDTGLAEEWTTRISKQLAANIDFCDRGYVHDPIPRSPIEWTTITLLVVVAPGMHHVAEMLDERIIPKLNQRFTSIRVRVAIAVHCEVDPAEAQIRAHWLLAVDRAVRMPWVITVLGEELPEPWARFIEDHVLKIDRPVAPPLRNKQGAVRDPVRLCPFTSLCYLGPVPPRDVLDLSPAEKRRNDLFAALRESQSTLVCDIVSLEALEMRVLTDIFNSVSELYDTKPAETYLTASAAASPKPHRGSHPNGQTVLAEERTSEQADHRVALDILTSEDQDLALRSSLPPSARPMELTNIMKYLERPVVSSAFPLIVYGSPGSGRGALLNHACAALQQTSGTKVIMYSADHDPSIVTFLLFILHHFGENPSVLGRGLMDGLSFDHLQLAAAAAIRNYSHQRQPIAFLVKNADHLDDAWRVGDHNAMWLPFSFPGHVRIVISVATESEFLHCMRQREQQPFDLLVRPVPRSDFVTVLRAALAKLSVSLASLGPEAETVEYHVNDQTGVIVEPKSVTGAIFQKQDADLVLYATLLASVMSLADRELLQGAVPGVINHIRFHVPDTCEALVAILLSYMESMYGAKLTKDVVCIIAAVPCTIPEIIRFAEGVYENKRFSALSIIAHLVDMQVIRVATNGMVRMVHQVVHRSAVAFFPPNSLDGYRSKIAIDFTDGVLARRHGFPSMFCRLTDLLLHVGDVRTLASILVDVALLDDLVLMSPGIQVKIYDAYWRCTHHTEHLRDIQMELFASRQFVHCPMLDRLRRGLAYFTQAKPNVWQSAVAMPFDSPLYAASVLAPRIPYPSAQRINKRYNETCSVWRRYADPLGLRHSSLQGSVAAVTGYSGVVEIVDVLSATVAARCATMVEEVPGKLRLIDLLGVTVRDLDSVLAIYPDRLVCWNWRSNEKRCFIGYTASLKRCAVRGDGLAAVAIECDTNHVVVLDLVTGRPLSQVPHRTDGVREAHFVASDCVLVVGVFELSLCRPDGTVVAMVVDTHHTIRCVASSPDGAWIVACAGPTAFLFGNTGEVLHTIDMEPHTILDVNFHPNGSLFAISNINGKIDVRHTLSGQQHRLLSTQVGPADYVVFTPDGTKLVARCATNLRMFDGTTFEDLGAISAHDGFVRYIALDNTNMVTVCDYGELKLWKTSRAFPSVSSMQTNSELSRNLVASGFVSKAAVVQVRVAPQDGALVVRTADGVLTVWSLIDAPREVPLRATITGVRGAFDFTRDGDLCFMKGSRTLVKWSLRRADNSNAAPTTEERLLPLEVEEPPEWLVRCGTEPSLDGVACCALYHNGVRILVYDAATMRLFVQYVGGHSLPIVGAEFAQDAVVTAAADRRVCVWSLLSKAQRSEMLHSAPIVALTAMPNGHLLLSDVDNSLLEFRVVGANFVRIRSITSSFVPQALGMVSGPLIAVANGTATVLLYDIDEGITVNHITASIDVHCIAVSGGDDRYVFLGSNGGTVELFRLKGLLLGDNSSSRR